MNIVKAFHRVLFPPFCVHCRTFLDQEKKLCQQCFNLIQPVVTTELKISSGCQIKVVALGKYEDPLKSLILSKRHRHRMSAQLLGELLWQHTTLQYSSFDMIVPVPLHWTRYAYRWFNQAYEMGKQMSVLSKIPVINALKRIRRTPFQTGFTREQRSKNVQGVFCLQADATNKDVLLIDDVMTTGATLKEAVRALKKSRPRSLTIAVAARVV